VPRKPLTKAVKRKDTISFGYHSSLWTEFLLSCSEFQSCNQCHLAWKASSTSPLCWSTSWALLLKFQNTTSNYILSVSCAAMFCTARFNAARSPSRAIKLDPAPHVLPLVLLQERNGWCKFLLLQSFSLLSNPGISSGAYKRLDLLGVYCSFGKTIFVFFHRLCTRILIIFGPTKSSSLPNIAVQKFLSHPSSLARRTRLPTFWRNFPWERYF